MSVISDHNVSVRSSLRPRLGFVGVGWIGRDRMEALAQSRLVRVAAVADPNPERVRATRQVAPDAVHFTDMDSVLDQDLDGIVIATPSALHAEQTMRALEAGLAVFCQKPLGRTAEETRCVVEAARSADLLLGIDLCYRHIRGVPVMRDLIQEGAIGDVYAADLVFHNAYGPDKAWARDPERAGGGCVIDLGIHLVDLALWTLGFPRVEQVTSRLMARGRPLKSRKDEVEDYAVARLDLQNGATVSLACSWELPLGCDAAIEACFYGTEGGISMRNVDGSFYDFVVERYWGTCREVLAGPPDAWGGRAAVGWARRLVEHRGFDASIESVVSVASVLDAIYEAA